MIKNVVIIQRDQLGRKRIVEIKDVDYMIDFNDLSIDETFEETEDIYKLRIDIANWNLSIDKKEMLTFKQMDLINSFKDFNPKRINKKGQQLIERTLSEDTETLWIELINEHNLNSWSDEIYCCVDQKEIIRAKINKLYELGFFKVT
mgnify:CR=1 FL=1